jgi:hypothetical protein
MTHTKTAKEKKWDKVKDWFNRNNIEYMGNVTVIKKRIDHYFDGIGLSDVAKILNHLQSNLDEIKSINSKYPLCMQIFAPEDYAASRFIKAAINDVKSGTTTHVGGKAKASAEPQPEHTRWYINTHALPKAQALLEDAYSKGNGDDVDVWLEYFILQICEVKPLRCEFTDQQMKILRKFFQEYVLDVIPKRENRDQVMGQLVIFAITQGMYVTKMDIEKWRSKTLSGVFHKVFSPLFAKHAKMIEAKAESK